MGKLQKYLAEFLGTFALVVVGSFAIVSAGKFPAQGAGLVSIALGFGLGLLIALYAFGEVSGGHFNPVVSLAAFFDRRLEANDLVAYLVSQLAGGVAASLVILAAYNQDTVKGTVTTSPDNWAGLVVEIVMSALFIAVILQVTRSGTYGTTAFVSIALALVVIHAASIPISGTSVNPARSFGPALVSGDFTDWWIWILGPTIGATLGWVVHRVVVVGGLAPTRGSASS